MVLEWEEVDGDARPWLAIRVVATSRRFLEVDRPWDGDELKEFRSSALELEGRRWPDERARLRRAVEAARGVSDRHFALQELIQRAYRLRDAHPEAMGDAIEACREQISLSKEVGQAMESSYGSSPCIMASNSSPSSWRSRSDSPRRSRSLKKHSGRPGTGTGRTALSASGGDRSAADRCAGAGRRTSESPRPVKMDW